MFMTWHPICRYFVPPDQKQPTLRGAEHRRVVDFLPFAVCGILGAASGQWNHEVLTWAMCELAALVRDVFGPACLGEDVTVRRARQLTDGLTMWMHRDFQGLFGPLHTPKLHRILAHVLDELRLRGNLCVGDTGVNDEAPPGWGWCWEPPAGAGRAWPASGKQRGGRHGRHAPAGGAPAPTGQLSGARAPGPHANGHQGVAGRGGYVARARRRVATPEAATSGGGARSRFPLVSTYRIGGLVLHCT